MRNIKLQITYDGSKYKGWQKLADNPMTIQEKIENVLSTMAGESISLIGCGRTDAGVHALDYTANFLTNTSKTNEEILHYLYKYLPEDIQVTSVKDCSERFHARYNALNKTYIYKINNSVFRDVFNRKYEYNLVNKLNVGKMQEASQRFIGTHDFAAFTTVKNKKKSTIKTIRSIEIAKNNNRISIEITSNSFLWNMVRIICGTLIEIGLGKKTTEDIDLIFNSRKREFAGYTVPAHGLFLKKVEY